MLIFLIWYNFYTFIFVFINEWDESFDSSSLYDENVNTNFYIWVEKWIISQNLFSKQSDLNCTEHDNHNIHSIVH